jgi:RNA polymerase sigma-70 factor, ECF subfamily
MANELDELTLARARQGEPAALSALVRHYEKPVFALVGRLMCSRAPAAIDDVAQEAFIRVIRGISRFDPSGPARLSTWIVTVATRTCLNALRGRNRDAPLDVAGQAAASDPGASPEELVLERERGHRIEAAMAALPAEMRAVLVLRAYHDLDYPEIAAALDLEVGTVKSRLSRARMALRQVLARGEQEEQRA